jgi:hypothetical protein
MGKVLITGTFSTIYTDPDKQDCKQVSITVPGQAGKQIKLEGISLDLQVTKAGITGTVWITANGVKVAEFIEKGLEYLPKTATPNLLLKDSESLVLDWYIKTANESSRARMTKLFYNYSFVDVPKNDETPAVLWVQGITKTQADELITNLKKAYPNIEAYVKIGD